MGGSFFEATARIELAIKVLQTQASKFYEFRLSALPLGLIFASLSY